MCDRRQWRIGFRPSPRFGKRSAGGIETVSNLGVVWVRLITDDLGERDEVAGHGGIDRE